MAVKQLGVAPSGSTDTATKAYADAKVADSIADGSTNVAPSQNAVFDALLLKVAGSVNGTPTGLTLWIGTEAQYNTATSNGASENSATIYMRRA